MYVRFCGMESRMCDHRSRNIACVTSVSFELPRLGDFEISFRRAVTRYCESLPSVKLKMEKEPSIRSFCIIKKRNDSR